MTQQVFSPEDGACKGYPTDWWFPIQKTGKRDELIALRETTQQAKIICAGCEYRQKCLEYSLEWEPWGIWGGKDEQERAQIRWANRISLGREGRIVFKGVGLRDANGGDFLLKNAAGN